MRQEFLTEALRGYFDVREYKEGKSRNQRRILSSTETIGFTVSFKEGDEKLQPFLQYAKQYDKDGEKRFSVSFKINYKCKWYDDLANETVRPDATYLENKPFIVIMRYAVVTPQGVFVPTPQNPIDKRAKGYWVNAIQFREADTNPFAAMPGAAPVPPMPQQQPQPQPQQQPQYQQPQPQYQQPQPQYQQPQPQYQQPQPQYQQQQPQQQQAGNMAAPMPPMFNENDNLPY